MNPPTTAAIEAALQQRIVKQQPCSGGDINTALIATLDDGRHVFVKTNPQANRLPGLFPTEAMGLSALRDAAEGSGLAVPEALAVGEDFLVLQAIEEASRPGDFEERLGRGLALLHQSSRGPRFGGAVPNYLGRWPQTQRWCDDQVTFWRECRLAPMLRDLTAYPEVVSLGQRLIDQLADVLAGSEAESVLIHGDLWSGNTCADRDGQVWIYDPAVSHACREVEFGMTRLFGFGERFEVAYQEVWPMPDGWERRAEVYRLHHLMSHLWHFGRSYESQCVSLLQKLV